MKRFLLSTLFIAFFFIGSKAQDFNRALSGSWVVDEVRVTLSSEGSKEADSYKGFWTPVKEINKPVEIDKEGNITFFYFGESEEGQDRNIVQAKGRIETIGNNLKMFFYGGNATATEEKGKTVSNKNPVSYTRYSYVISGKQLIITYEDPMMKEICAFTKK